MLSRRIVPLMRRGGRNGNAQRSAEQRVLGFAPFSWPRADYYSLATGKVSAWPDRMQPAHSFSQALSGSQVAEPVSDAALNGRHSGVFTATQFYDSTYPASAWKFLHDGTGCETFDVFVPTNTAGNSFVWATRQGLALGEVGGRLYITAQVIRDAANGVGTVFTTSSASVLANGVATYANLSHSSASSPQYTSRVKTATAGSGSYALTPSSSNPQGALRLGAGVIGGVAKASMRWAESIFFNRVLSAGERAVVQSYLLSRYGI